MKIIKAIWTGIVGLVYAGGTAASAIAALFFLAGSLSNANPWFAVSALMLGFMATLLGILFSSWVRQPLFN